METGDQEKERARYRHRGQRGKSGVTGGNQTDARWPAWPGTGKPVMCVCHLL